MQRARNFSSFLWRRQQIKKKTLRFWYLPAWFFVLYYKNPENAEQIRTNNQRGCIHARKDSTTWQWHGWSPKSTAKKKRKKTNLRISRGSWHYFESCRLGVKKRNWDTWYFALVLGWKKVDPSPWLRFLHLSYVAPIRWFQKVVQVFANSCSLVCLGSICWWRVVPGSCRSATPFSDGVTRGAAWRVFICRIWTKIVPIGFGK